MKNIRVLISGASIAGPALAFWLERFGFEVTVAEKAKVLRRGGQAVDFKGPVHLAVLEKMGILQAVRQASVPSEDGIVVDAKGRKIGVVPGRFAGGEINIPRGDLAGILHDLTAARCEYLFGESITSFVQTASGVEVTFIHAASRTFDLVIGADGIHSNVRRLAFGPEADFVKHLGYHYALVGLSAGDDDVMYNEPGRMVALGGGKAPAFFVFASGALAGSRESEAAQKQFLVDAYRGGRWRLPELMAKVPGASDFYLDSISRVSVDRYARGRVALVGDAACGNALGGFGTGLAIVGAYVLAGELHRCGGDHHGEAFAKYEVRFRGYAAAAQHVNAGRFMAPATRLGIRARNLLFSTLAAVEPLMKLVDRPASKIELEDYDREV